MDIFLRLSMGITKDLFAGRLGRKLKEVMPDGLNHSPQRKKALLFSKSVGLMN